MGEKHFMLADIEIEEISFTPINILFFRGCRY